MSQPAVLRAAYEAARGRYLRPVTYEQIAARLPFGRNEFQKVAPRPGSLGLFPTNRGRSRHRTQARRIGLGGTKRFGRIARLIRRVKLENAGRCTAPHGPGQFRGPPMAPPWPP